MIWLLFSSFSFSSLVEEELIDNKKIQKKLNKLKINSEYVIPIVHFRREINPGRSTLFVDFYCFNQNF